MARVAAPRLGSLQALCLGLGVVLLLLGIIALPPAYGDPLPSRSLTLGQATPGANDTYTLGFQLPAVETLGSVELQICAEGPLFGTPCSAPAGLDMSHVALGAQSGETGFGVRSATANTVTLGRTPANTTANVTVSYELQNITDPSSIGSYYGRIQTFASADGSGGNTDFGGLAFAITNALEVSTTVPPYLYFCVGLTITGTDCSTATGDYIDYGNFSSSIASAASSQMVAASNADTGYNITVNGATLTSGNNTIPPLTAPDVSRPGTSQFGINLVANQDPRVGQNPSGNGAGEPTLNYSRTNAYVFNPGDTVVAVSGPDALRAYTVSYVTNVAKNQSPGVYTTTLTYIAIANF